MSEEEEETAPHFDLRTFMKKAGQPYAIFRGGVRTHQVDGLQNADKVTGRPYIGFFPGADVQPGDLVEGLISGDRRRIEEVSSDVLNGEVFLVKGYYQQGAADMPTATDKPDPRKVFVVFGRNLAARDEMYTFVGALGLRPIEFDEAVLQTGEASPTIDRVLDAAFSVAQAVIILLTGDDEGWLRPEFRRPNDPASETQLTPQPRGNVIFEAGMAFGRNPKRSILVQFGGLRPFSDFSARYAIRLTGNGTFEERARLKNTLQAAGCAVEDTGTHWYQAGDFSKVFHAERDTTPET